MKFKFADRISYPNEVFEIDHYHEGDPSRSRVWLRCITDPSVQINRYVNINELKLL